MKMAKKVYAFYLQHTDKHQASGLEVLNNFIKNTLPDRIQKTIIIDNNLTTPLEANVGVDKELVSGDNSTREFSGWDRGLSWAAQKHELSDHDAIILANDTFHRSYGSEYLSLFKNLEQHLRNLAVIGYFDGYPAPVTVFNLELQYWIRSNFIVCSYGVLKKFLPLSIPFRNEIIFSNKMEEFFLETAPFSNNYQEYLKTWLFGDFVSSNDFKESWHSQQKISAANFGTMKEKARSIFCEHYLSARIFREHTLIVNVRN